MLMFIKLQTAYGTSRCFRSSPTVSHHTGNIITQNVIG